jgi:hypothetical protein
MDRQKSLQDYLEGYDTLTKLIKTATEEMLYYKPAANKWSAVEIIVHLADAECNGFVRFRKAIAESGCNVDLWDHEAWTLKLNYQNQNVVTSLALFKMIRFSNFEMLSRVDNKKWNNFIMHPEKGKITLSNLLKLYTDHLNTHINQIKKNFQLYNKQTVQ